MSSLKKAIDKNNEDRMMAGILKELSKPSGKDTCFCSYPVFQAVYRAAEQSGNPGYLMLCSLADGDGRLMYEGETLKETSGHLSDAIETNIPKWGVVCRYDGGQYLLLLVGTEKEECEELERRIEAGFVESCSEGNIRWEIKRVTPKAFAGQERRRSGR